MTTRTQHEAPAPRAHARAATFAALALTTVMVGAAAARTAAVPPHADGVTAITRVLDSVPLVAIMDEHLLAQEGEFYQRLIRDPRFAQKANDIIVEFGNELYQPVADRYVRGESVPADSVRMIWENNTQGPLLTTSSPMYANILHAAREVNAKLPAPRRLRVLLGDPAIEWNTVTRDELWEIHKRRGDRMRELARDSVVAKGRRGIVIAGGNHLRRDRPAGATQDAKWGDLASRVFIVSPHLGFGGRAVQYEPVMDSLPLGSIVRVRGTFLESIEVDDAAQETPAPDSAASVAAGPPAAPQGMRRANEGRRLGDHYDAVLYLGPIKTFTAVFADIERVRRDPTRLRELHRRSCMMVGRGLDTARVFRTPVTASLYPNGRRRSRVEFEPITQSAPQTMPPLPPNLPEPCATLLRRP